jgi:hypothetical protein
MIGVEWARGYLQTGGGADGGDGLAAEAQGGDADEVVVGQLGGGVALDAEGEFLGGHADAVVDDFETVDAAVVEADDDAGGAGVERVFDKFLGGRGGSFDDLAGGYAVDGGFSE